jgi:hypothetical protein
MLPNIIGIVSEFVDSVLAPVPGFARGYVILLAAAAGFWILGMGRESTDDAFDQMIEGIGVTRSGLNRFVAASAPIIASGAVFGGKAIATTATTVGQGICKSGSSMVEVEEAPIKIGPVVEIYGIRVGLIGFLLGLFGLGGLFFSGSIPLVP